MRATANTAVALVLAPTCVACDAPLPLPLDGPVCRTCWDSVVLAALLAPEHRTPWDMGETASTAVDRGCVAVAYSGTLRRIVHAFKYDGRRSLSVPLGTLMRDAAADMLADADCLVPVPLHLVKRVSRGFNQAGDLARQLGPPVVTALWRTRLTRSQVGRTAQERRHAHRTLAPWPLLTRGHRDRFIAGRVVVVVDDVRTTGSTLDECAVVLKRMGAREVRAVALAQTPLHPAPGQAAPEAT